jgi:hypothetical protein
MLVSTGSVPRATPLINLLCGHGADPNLAAQAAASHGEREALHALIRRGARFDLPVAAARGRVEDACMLLPSSGREDRHLALALASASGHVDIVRMLLDAGEDPKPIQPGRWTFPFHTVAPSRLCRPPRSRPAACRTRCAIGFEGHPRHEGKTEIETYLRSRDASGEK